MRSAREDSEAAKEIRNWDEILYQVSLKSNTWVKTGWKLGEEHSWLFWGGHKEANATAEEERQVTEWVGD